MICLMPQEKQREDNRGGELGVEGDPEIARVIETMLSDLARAWTVQELAKSAGMSRSTLARRFVDAVGEAPLQHLARLRMERAANLLETTEDALSRIAPRVGYETEFAFSRAFRRHYGVPPGVFRRRARAASSGDTFCLAA
jgi:transcriptional regulator GlxA family with amidase domain